MPQRVRITNDSLNSYGTRVLTSGMDIEQYTRNPVLLYMHKRGSVIGYVSDLRVENDELTGQLHFDCATELSTQCKKQYEFGSLKMVSAGLDVLEMSDAPDLLLPGQTSPTITRSKLFEVSLVDIGANDDAIVLTHNGQQVTLSRDGANPLPLLNNNKPITPSHMDTKELAKLLGLPDTATTDDITKAINRLLEAQKELEKNKKQLNEMADTHIHTLVSQAIAEHRLSKASEAQFIALGKQIGADQLQKTLATMQPQVRLSQVIAEHSNTNHQSTEPKDYTRPSQVPADQLLTLRKENKDLYRQLYKAEYGIDCNI